MTWRSFVVLCAIVVSARAANAQDARPHIRFSTSSATEERRWEGDLERLTSDSLHIRVRGTDTVAAFPRGAIRSVERRRRVNRDRAAGIGCLTGATALGALGVFGTRDPDSPGRELKVGVAGLVAGCILGGAGGLVVAAIRTHDWQLWTLPDDLPDTTDSEFSPN